MYYVVTGAAGFIGSNIVRALNARGVRNIIAVDNLARGEKFANLADCDIADFIDKHDFIERVQAGHFDGEIEAVLHQGACTDRSVGDGRYLMENNYRYSLILLDWCLDQDIQFIYASSAAVYGAGSVLVEERQHERPLDVAAYAKFLFDQIVRQRLARQPGSQVVGLRYFNVYGPGEDHKGDEASAVLHHCRRFLSEGRLRLSAGSLAQGRDCVHVDDVARVNLFFLDHPDTSGIFNVGSGTACSSEEIAAAAINACRRAAGATPLGLPELKAQGLLADLPPAGERPAAVADLSRLRAAGYEAPMRSLEEGVAHYVDWLNAHV